jgi:hypothetical protein
MQSTCINYLVVDKWGLLGFLNCYTRSRGACIEVVLRLHAVAKRQY